MNLREVSDDVYRALTSAAEANRQSLSAFVVDRLTEAAKVARLSDYTSTHVEPRGSGATLEEATAAVREVSEAS